MTKLIAALAFLLAIALPARAQDAPALNPALSALDRGIDDAGRQRPLDLARLQADVKIAGTLAETNITAQFRNPGREAVEGRFALQLPKGSIVTGYALDVGGEMIDGVLLDQPKAREVYTDKVRRGIDPGLAEVSRDDVFSTRVFPIFPGSGRTIRVRFVTALDPQEGFILPLGSTGRIGEVSLDLRADEVAVPAEVQFGRSALRWTPAGSGFAAQARLRDTRLPGALRIAPARPAATLVTTLHGSGDSFFQLFDVARTASSAAMRPGRLRIYWDRSRSRLDDDVRGEAALVRRLIERLGVAETDIVLFGSSQREVRRVTSGRDAEALLSQVNYRGATSFENLSRLPLPAADLCILFSDGIASIERRDPLRPGCMLHAVTSAPDADLPFLRGITSRSGGEAMVLGRSADGLVERLTRQRSSIMDIRGDGGEPVDYAILDGGGGALRAVGRLPAAGGLNVRISGPTGIENRHYAAPSPRNGHDAAAAFWARDRIAAIAGDPAQAPVFKDLSRRYSVAGPEMAFVVLEAPHDYVQDEVAPPDTYPKHLFAAYTQMKAQYDQAKADDQSRWQQELVRRWDEHKKWWATRFDPNAKPKANAPKGGLPPPPPPVIVFTSPPAVRNAPSAPGAAADASEGSIAVTGSRIARPELQSASPVATGGAERGGRRAEIQLTPWAPDRPYLRALDAATAANFEEVLLAQEKEHGGLPAFYLDVADWMMKRGRKAEAVQILLSALDLRTANNETIGIVASRLMRYGELDRAIYLFERLAIAEEFRPQPKRSLALALERRAARRSGGLARADLDRALGLLEEIIETPQRGDYEGVELISLADANAMLPAYRKLGGTRRPFDPRLVALLDVDLRVILDWTSGNNDLDLWVTEPNSDKSFYGNPLTRAGGKLSNDMTSGYGPEEYMIRRALPGTYGVSANIYASDRIDPNGAPVITARLIRNFGRPSQQEETVDIELTPRDRGQKAIGRVVVQKP